MKDKPGLDLATQMKEARELLEEGDVREALVLAMDVLWRELDQLRDTLTAVQEEVATGAASPEPAKPEFVWPGTLSQLLH